MYSCWPVVGGGDGRERLKALGEGQQQKDFLVQLLACGKGREGGEGRGVGVEEQQ